MASRRGHQAHPGLLPEIGPFDALGNCLGSRGDCGGIKECRGDRGWRANDLSFHALGSPSSQHGDFSDAKLRGKLGGTMAVSPFASFRQSTGVPISGRDSRESFFCTISWPFW
jgi:hypothetical protein